MNLVKKLDKITSIITKVFAYVAVVGLLFNVVIILANVIGRKAGHAIVGAEEYVSMTEVIVIFMALGFTQFTGGLVHVCFFMKKFPKRGPVIMWAFHHLIGALVVALIFWQTCRLIPNVTQVTTALLIPFKPFYGVIAVGCVAYFIAEIYETIKAIVAIFDDDVYENVLAHLPA